MKNKIAHRFSLGDRIEWPFTRRSGNSYTGTITRRFYFYPKKKQLKKRPMILGGPYYTVQNDGGGRYTVSEFIVRRI